MTDILSPEIKINLDRERKLLVDLAALKAYQSKTGKNPLEPQGINLNNLDDLQVILWAGLLNDDPDLKYDDVGKMVNASNIRIVQGLLLEALFATTFEKADKTDSRPLAKTAQKLPSKRSGKLGGLISGLRKLISGG